MYRIFFNQNEIIFTNQLIKKKNAIIIDNIYVFIDVNKFLMQNINQCSKIIFYYKDIDLFFNFFCSHFYIIHAAGGIVNNLNNNLILIYRYGKWDLPKGKVERNETFQEAAVREVQEECGVESLVVNSFFKTTYHIFYLNHIFYLKFSHWYIMTVDSNVMLIPQIKEGINQVRWVEQIEVYKLLHSSYQSIKYLIYDFYNYKIML